MGLRLPHGLGIFCRLFYMVSSSVLYLNFPCSPLYLSRLSLSKTRTEVEFRLQRHLAKVSITPNDLYGNSFHFATSKYTSLAASKLTCKKMLCALCHSGHQLKQTGGPILSHFSSYLDHIPCFSFWSKPRRELFHGQIMYRYTGWSLSKPSSARPWNKDLKLI